MADPEMGPGTLSTRWWLIQRPFLRRLEHLRRIHSRKSLTEVFPWMEHAIAVGAVVGGSAGFVMDRGWGGLILGSIVGVLAGTWLALGWAVEVDLTGPTTNRAELTGELWDPWLDETSDREIDEVHLDDDVVELDPGRARVRPRVISGSDGGSSPLDGEISSIFEQNDRGSVCISGPDGSGKTTALAYLARVLPPHHRVTFLDRADLQAIEDATSQGRVIYTTANGFNPQPSGSLVLAPWEKDDWIEYLLTGNRSRCASVMARLDGKDEESELLGGIAELWSIVLDLMADDDAIEGPRQALRVAIGRVFAEPDYRKVVEADCLFALLMSGKSESRRLARLRRHVSEEDHGRLIRHRAIQLALGADRLASELAEGGACDALVRPLPRDLIREAGLRIVERPGAVEQLRTLVRSSEPTLQPMAASLLHATGLGWKPGKPVPLLRGALLDEAAWAGVILVEADLREVNLRRADLWGSRLDGSRFTYATLAAADLRTASLNEASLLGADLSFALMSKVSAANTNFQSARLVAADLEEAVLNGANFQGADLTNVRFRRAILIGAKLSRATLELADFSGANLTHADLRGLKLAVARFGGATFRSATLAKCDLEGMKLPNVDCAWADFSEALLTGSFMPEANFRCANFQGAGLANVDWERADLRGADLRQVAFHLGSSRSGLVDSTIACEGSRTGFYTDDYNDQDFKTPEEIRKANLQGADLRGANLDGVDFYLVDLRGAKLDADQVLHLQRTGAILESRA